MGVCRQSQSTGLWPYTPSCRQYMCIHENVVGLANLYAFSFMNILLAPSDDMRRSFSRARWPFQQHLCSFYSQIQNFCIRYRYIDGCLIKESRATACGRDTKKLLKFFNAQHEAFCDTENCHWSFCGCLFLFRIYVSSFFRFWLNVAGVFIISFGEATHTDFYGVDIYYFSSWLVRTKKLIYCTNAYPPSMPIHTCRFGISDEVERRREIRNIWRRRHLDRQMLCLNIKE